MKIIKPEFTILTDINNAEALANIERCARTCYKSENNSSPESIARFVRNLVKRGHEAMLEHYSVTVKFICDRGVSHEIIRHRLASYAQESTRYCNYSDARFENEITVIEPCFIERDTIGWKHWKELCKKAEQAYFNLLGWGCTAQEARAVLPTSLKTELIVTMNLREWRHFFKLRAIGTTGSPHPQMRELAIPLLEEFKRRIPEVFDDLEVKKSELC